MPAYVQATGRQKDAVSPIKVKKCVEHWLAITGLTAAELSLVFCDDVAMHKLNLGYRGKDKTTDVLAFPMNAPIDAPPSHGQKKGHAARPERFLLGDIVVSLPTARRQARAHGRSFDREIMFLLAHGFLHLLGFDHPNKHALRRMHARSDVLISSLRSEKITT